MERKYTRGCTMPVNNGYFPGKPGRREQLVREYRMLNEQPDSSDKIRRIRDIQEELKYI